jgi:hypothetical protein
MAQEPSVHIEEKEKLPPLTTTHELHLGHWTSLKHCPITTFTTHASQVVSAGVY